MLNTDKIRALNDAFRRSFQGGRVVITRGIADRPDLAEILHRVQTYEGFSEENDPYNEHDFGAFKVGGAQLFFKLDYYDANMEGGSPEPSDSAITMRVLTVMLAEEY